MKKLIVLLFVLLMMPPLLAQAQMANIRYVEQFDGLTVGAKVTAAQNSCHVDTSINCTLILSPILAAWADGAWPVIQSHVAILDLRVVGGIELQAVFKLKDPGGPDDQATLLGLSNVTLPTQASLGQDDHVLIQRATVSSGGILGVRLFVHQQTHPTIAENQFIVESYRNTGITCNNVTATGTANHGCSFVWLANDLNRWVFMSDQNGVDTATDDTDPNRLGLRQYGNGPNDASRMYFDIVNPGSSVGTGSSVQQVLAGNQQITGFLYVTRLLGVGAVPTDHIHITIANPVATLQTTGTAEIAQFNWNELSSTAAFAQYRGTTAGSNPNQLRIGTNISGGQLVLLSSNGQEAARFDSNQKFDLASGMLPDASGFKHSRSTTGCATAASVGAVCNTTITWGTAFADANYSVDCDGLDITSGVPANGGTHTKVAASIQFRTVAITAAAAQFTNISCTAVHD